MTDILTDLSQLSLATAIEANVTEFFRTFAQRPEVEVHDDPEMLWAVSHVRFPLLNFTARVRLDASRVDDAIEATIARCRTRGVPAVWSTGPSTQPSDLGRRLTAYGFTEALEPGMAADLLAIEEPSTTPLGLEIERVADFDTLRKWSQVTTLGFGMPESVAPLFYDGFAHLGLEIDRPLRHYLGRLDGEPVATSTLFLAAGVAGIYRVATLPAYRGRGIGAAITLAPLLEARSAGYRVATLHASPMGVEIYRRLGFKPYCTIGRYIWTGR